MKQAPRSHARRGFAMLVVLGVIMITAFVLVVVQTSALGQAASGRESLARVRAYWAARAGIESTIARLEYDTQNPNQTDGYAVFTDLSEVSQDTLQGAQYSIFTSAGKSVFDGPTDSNAKININTATRDQLLLIEPFMTEDVADSVLDWIDSDDDVREVGAELGYYQSMTYAYKPRNAPMQSIQELELVAGTDPLDVRGEDWNLNGILDDNENDGDVSWPPDNADGVLDAGWSGVLTAATSSASMYGASGDLRVDLSSGDSATLISRTQVSAAQADIIVAYAANAPEAKMSDFIRLRFSQIAQAAGQNNAQAPELTVEQLGALLNECTIGVPDPATPGKININTCDQKIFEYIPQINSTVADTLITERAAKSTGFASMAELLEIQGISRTTAATLYDLFDVVTTGFEVTSRGKDVNTGIEVEISATIDRSSLPIVIKELYAR